MKKEVSNNDENTKNIKIINKSKKIKIPILALIIIAILIIFLIPKKENNIEIKVKSSLDKIVEKSDLETLTVTYNVIAKKCKDEKKCDKNSNNINDFQYVASCKGTITAGIDFKEVKIDVDKKNKKITITVPEASIKGDPNIGSVNFLNGQNSSASELPDARNLCQETVISKSEKDEKLIATAKEQATIVLEEFYNQWIKAYDSSYTVVVK